MDAAREQRGMYFTIPNDDLGYDEIVKNARRKLEIRSASAMPWKVTKPANASGSSWERPCASDWSKMETIRLNSSCSQKDHEDITIESQRTQATRRVQKRLIRTTSRTEVMFPCRTFTVHKQIPIPKATNILEENNPFSTRNWIIGETTGLGRVASAK